MRDRLRLAIVSGVLVVPASALGLQAPAAAAEETCQGVPATIVGTPGANAYGTPGNDVIVSNGAIRVDGGFGDDLICTTNTKPDKHVLLSVSGGAGSNVVDRRGEIETTAEVSVWLSGSSDVFYGSAAAEQVSLESRQVGAGPFTVLTGAGDDSVFVDPDTEFGQPSTVDTGPGDDRFAMYGDVTNLQVSDGDGDDTIGFSDYDPSRWTIDAHLGVATFGHGLAMGFSGFDTYELLLSNPTTRVTFLGSRRAETVSLEGQGEIKKAKLGRGDDVLRFERFALPKTDLAGGGGRDTLVVLADRKRGVTVDLPNRYFAMGTLPRNPLRQFENATVEGGRVTLLGDGKDNVLEWWGCEGGKVSGGAGDDVVRPTTPIRVCTDVQLVVAGGPGDDRLTGSRYRDVLDGGPGRDTSDGRAGFDICPASEVLRGCERT